MPLCNAVLSRGGRGESPFWVRSVQLGFPQIPGAKEEDSVRRGQKFRAGATKWRQGVSVKGRVGTITDAGRYSRAGGARLSRL